MNPLNSEMQSGRSLTRDQLLPPRSGSRIVARERLLAQLTEARQKRCIVVQGPAGCGKSALIAAWRQALLTLDFDVAWLTLSEHEADVTRWLDGLLLSLEQVDPAITREASLLGERGADPETVERTVISLLHGITAHPRPVTLVLDDLHHVSSPRIHEILQWLLDYAPANFHVVLLSRAAIPLSRSRLRDQALVLELDQRDLRFTLAESSQFLKTQLPNISDRDARALHELTDGWVAGLQLLCAHWKRARPRSAGTSLADSLVRTHVQNAGAFAQYFEHEVLSRLSHAETELLTSAAACSRFCPALVVALTQPVHSLPEAVMLLERLESDGMFIVPVEGTDPYPWYRLHPLLRETLLERFHARSENEQQRVHATAWQWFRQHNYLEEAVTHAVLAKDAAAAADMVLEHARGLFIRGNLRQVVRLVRLLPDEEVQARIGLRLWKIRMQLYAREFDAAATAMDLLERDTPADDLPAWTTLTLLRGVLALQRDDTDAAMSALQAVRLDYPGVDSLAVRASKVLESWLYMHRGEYERARRIHLDAPPALVDGTQFTLTTTGSLSGRCMVGFSYMLEGQVLEAERISREVLKEAERHGASCAEPACFSAALLGDALYEQNDIEGAIRLLEDRVDVLERVSIPDSVLKVLMTLSASHWVAGNQLDAFAYLDRLEDYASQLGLDRLLAHSLAARTTRHLLCGELDAADSCLARLQSVDARRQPGGPGAHDEIPLVLQQARIRRSIVHEDFNGAATGLAPLIAWCETRGWLRNAAQLRMQNGLVALRRQRPDTARSEIPAALRLGHRLGLLRTLLDADPSALQGIAGYLPGGAVAGGAVDPVLSFYLARLQAASERDADRMRSAPGATLPGQTGAARLQALDLSERESEVLRLLAQALPNKKIARALGLSPETVKWHLKKVYGKLGVTSRDAAVARVRDLELDLGAGSPLPPL